MQSTHSSVFQFGPPLGHVLAIHGHAPTIEYTEYLQKKDVVSWHVSKEHLQRRGSVQQHPKKPKCQPTLDPRFRSSLIAKSGVWRVPSSLMLTPAGCGFSLVPAHSQPFRVTSMYLACAFSGIAFKVCFTCRSVSGQFTGLQPIVEDICTLRCAALQEPSAKLTVRVMSLDCEKVTLPWISSIKMGAGSSSTTRFQPKGMVTWRIKDEYSYRYKKRAKLVQNKAHHSIDLRHLTFCPSLGFPSGKRELSLQVSGSDHKRMPSRLSTASSGSLVHPSTGQMKALALRALWWQSEGKD